MILYKYRDWQNKHHKTLLTDCELWFSSCKHFNDPFDCKIITQYEGATDEQLRKHFQETLDGGYPEADERQREELLQGAISRIRDPLARAEQNRKWDEAKENDFGIFTLSRTKKNILMWSHYAANQTGFCVGLHRPSLDHAFDAIYTNRDIYVDQDEVEYSESYPQILPCDIDGNPVPLALQRTLLVKSENWRYEEEYRYILFDHTDLPLQIPRSVIVEIILGCQMPDKYRQEIIEVLRAHTEHPTLFQAKKMDLEFGLDFEEIPY